MKEYTQEQLNEARELMKFICRVSEFGVGSQDDELDELVNTYRHNQTKANMIKICCWFWDGRAFFPYKEEIVNGEPYWKLTKMRNGVDDSLAQLVYTSINKIPKRRAMDYSWLEYEGYEFFTESDLLEKCEYVIVNEADNFVPLYIDDIKFVLKLLDKIEKADYKFTEEDVLQLADILSQERVWIRNKKYKSKKTGEEYYGFFHLFNYLIYDGLTFFDTNKGKIRFELDEFRDLEEVKQDESAVC